MYVDVLIVGAGISGIGAAYYLQRDQPSKTYAIVEARGSIGGTWDLFRYPGIRSDSDLHTFGYEFKPWVHEDAIADGDAIMAYLRETVQENDIGKNIRFHHAVKRVSWSSERARWTTEIERTDTGETITYESAFLFAATGYYRYDQGYRPRWEGEERFKGTIVHPQHWPESLDYAGKRVVVIGSGATAVTLIPAMADKAAHITMLQRTPTYVMPIPKKDAVANALKKALPAKTAYALSRKKNIARQRWLFAFCQRYPALARKLIRAENVKRLPEGYPVDEHFNPPYGPWDQRLCAVPDADLFKTIRAGKASVVTDRIEAFTERGIKLASGRELEADVVVTATGLNLQLFGGIEARIDGVPFHAPDHVAFKGMMFDGVPNLAFALGYTNSSWTLKVGLLCEHFCRVLGYMDRHGYAVVVPERRDPNMPTRPLLDFGAGYVKRAIEQLPRQGSRYPWVMSMDYAVDAKGLREGPVEDPNLRFSRKPDAARPGPERRVPSRGDSTGRMTAGRVRVRGLDIAYDLRGSGEPILLLPGLTMRRFMWPDALCDALVAGGFAVVRMDNRDAGESSRFQAKPPDVGAAMWRSMLGLPVDVPYRLEDMAGDAFGLMSELGYERYHVAGASMGGMIAQTMAILQPSRLFTLTSVMSTPGGRRYSMGKPSAMKALLTRMPAGHDAQVEHLMNTLRILHGSELPFDEDEGRAIALSQIEVTSAAAAARHLGAIFEGAGRRLDKLRAVTTPTLVIHGTQDPLLPLRGARAMARLMPRADLLEVRGMGHCFPAPVLPLIADAMTTLARKATLADPAQA